jgi:hypothetical protein
MKKTNLPFILLLLLFAGAGTVFFSCKKKVVLPQVVIVSVNVFSLDSVVLTGRITSTGDGTIQHSGFEVSTNSSFTGSNLVLLNGSQTTFSTVVPATHGNTYYFKAIASSNEGIAYSSAITYAVPLPPPAIAPCTLVTNYVTDNGASFSISAYGGSSNPTWGSYEVDFYGNNEDVDIYFPGIPANGVYTTVADPSSISTGQVSITITGFNPNQVNGGQKVYVGIDTSGKTTVSFCSLVYTISGVGSTTISGKGTY